MSRRVAAFTGFRGVCLLPTHASTHPVTPFSQVSRPSPQDCLAHAGTAHTVQACLAEHVLAPKEDGNVSGATCSRPRGGGERGRERSRERSRKVEREREVEKGRERGRERSRERSRERERERQTFDEEFWLFDRGWWCRVVVNLRLCTRRTVRGEGL